MGPEQREKLVAEILAFNTVKLPKEPECFFAADAANLLLHEPDDNNAKLQRGGKELPAWLRVLYDVPLLNHKDEVGQFLKYNYARRLILQAQRTITSLDDKALEKCRRVLTIAKSTHQLLVIRNLRLVVSVAKNWAYRNRWATIEEFISEGNIALIRAVQLYEVGRGFKFSTYASWAVQNAMTRFYMYRRKIWQKEWLASQWSSTLTRTKTNERRSDWVEHDAMESVPGKGDDTGLSDQSELNKLLYRAIRKLDKRLQNIVLARYGLDRDALTLKEVGVLNGISKERIRQLESRAMRMLYEELAPLAPLFLAKVPDQPEPEESALSKWQQVIYHLIVKKLSVDQIAKRLDRKPRHIKAQITKIRNRGFLANVA